MPDALDGERPVYREAIDRSQRQLIAQGLDPKAARVRARELAFRSEDREDNRDRR